MPDLKEALKLEELEDYIENKEVTLDELYDMNEALLRRYHSFVSEYNEKMASFTEMINKKIDDIYSSLDSFESDYEKQTSQFQEKKKDVLAVNPEYDGELTDPLRDELARKLISESDKMKNKTNEMIDNYIAEFERAQAALSKAITRMNKLRNREMKK